MKTNLSKRVDERNERRKVDVGRPWRGKVWRHKTFLRRKTSNKAYLWFSARHENNLWSLPLPSSNLRFLDNIFFPLKNLFQLQYPHHFFLLLLLLIFLISCLFLFFFRFTYPIQVNLKWWLEGFEGNVLNEESTFPVSEWKAFFFFLEEGFFRLLKSAT